MRRGLLSHWVATCQSASLPARSVLVKSCECCDGVAGRRNPVLCCCLGLHADYARTLTASNDYSCPPAGVDSLDRSAGNPRGLSYSTNNGLLGAGLYDSWPTER